MIKDRRVLAIIPARGGSKGLHRKNIRLMAGKPLIAWTMEEARKSFYIDRLIVSSDSEEIINAAKKYGVEAPFVRPSELAGDASKSIDVVKHGLEYFGSEFDVVIVLQPTSPLRTHKDIDGAFELMIKKGARAVVSVCETEHPVQWTGTLNEDLNMRDFLDPAFKNLSRQELRKTYRLNGAIYIAERDYLYLTGGFIGEGTYAFIMEKKNSVDIDDIVDFKLAEILLKDRKEENEIL